MYNTIYNPPPILFTGHLQTIYPSLFRKVNITYTRERINTPDNDFLDLDWLKCASDKLAVLSHGLEGDSKRPYMTGMASALNKIKWDVLAWNFRGCSGEINNNLRMYHSGTTDDLHSVIQHALLKGYKEVVLLGFSMGGNQILKYLAENRDTISKTVTRAIVFSVPCDLTGSAHKLATWSNKIYMKRFLKLLGEKMAIKAQQYPEDVDFKGYNKIKTFFEFDDRYTAPIHGFKSALDYYQKCSSKQFIPRINRPTIIINAMNDPFLSKECFPFYEVKNNSCVQLITPDEGGHVGFPLFNKEHLYWSEKCVLHYLNNGHT